MTSTVCNASILAKSATESTAKEFIELVGKAKVHLSKENRSLGKLQIIGKLVEVPAQNLIRCRPIGSKLKTV